MSTKKFKEFLKNLIFAKILIQFNMNKKTLLFFFLALMVSPFAALAQNITVSGKVVSSDDG